MNLTSYVINDTSIAKTDTNLSNHMSSIVLASGALAEETTRQICLLIEQYGIRCRRPQTLSELVRCISGRMEFEIGVHLL